MPPTASQFQAALASCGLFSERQLQEWLAGVLAPSSTPAAEALADRLVAEGRLSRFQADVLLAGDSTPLMLGEYEICGPLGAGGMGVVYQGRHRLMQRDVAIKLLRPERLRADSMERFVREMTAAAQVNHVNVVQAYHAGEQNGVLYLVMALEPGRDVESLLGEGVRLPPAQALDIAVQAARGLQAAHRQLIVHRDVKPSNLLVNPDGVVKLLDLGLARLERAEEQASTQGAGPAPEASPGDSVGDLVGATASYLTSHGQLLGTLAYMSPEQAEDSRTAGPPADVYSLGCTICRMLLGQSPFARDTVVKTLVAHREAPRPELHRDCAAFPPALSRFVQRMVDPRPESRPAMAEVVATLERWIARIGNSPAANDMELAAFLLNQPETSTQQLSDSTRHSNATRDQSSEFRSDAASDLPPELPPADSIVRRKSPTTKAGGGARVLAAVGAFLVVSIVALWLVNRTPSAPTQESGSSEPARAIAPFDPSKSNVQQRWATHLGIPATAEAPLQIPLVLIPPGEFWRGADEAELAAARAQLSPREHALLQWEAPRRRIQLTQPFYLATRETTVADFEAFVSAEGYQTLPERDGRGGLGEDQTYGLQYTWRFAGYPLAPTAPVTNVTWHDAAAFCNFLSRQEGLAAHYTILSDGTAVAGDGVGYRLPTEAEWEFACRAGAESMFYFGNTARGAAGYLWSVDNAEQRRPQPTSLKRPNAFGLFDMSGNVLEWCGDAFEPDFYERSPAADPLCRVGDERLARGGNTRQAVYRARCAARNILAATDRSLVLGFRVARSIHSDANAAP